jgi:hypothetical protein
MMAALTTPENKDAAFPSADLEVAAFLTSHVIATGFAAARMHFRFRKACKSGSTAAVSIVPRHLACAYRSVPGFGGTGNTASIQTSPDRLSPR